MGGGEGHGSLVALLSGGTGPEARCVREDLSFYNGFGLGRRGIDMVGLFMSTVLGGRRTHLP